MIYSVRHLTCFRYTPEVRESIMEVRMQPRSEARQRCLTFSLEVAPHANVMFYRDFLGNTVHHFDIPGRQGKITISAHAIVDVEQPPFDAGQTLDWTTLDAGVAEAGHWDMLLPSRYAKPTALLEDLERELRINREAAPPLDSLLRLNAALYRTFEYAPNSTQVDSPIDHALRTRRGVCQDFAHVMIALVRRLGIPCRYLSGYLFHADRDLDRSLEGATHAWVEAFLPDLGWVAFDPTNNLTGSQRHIRVAVGRDYADVPPTRGVYKGVAEDELSVSVAVTLVDAPQPEELRPATVIRRPLPAEAAALQSAAVQDQQQQ